MTFECPTPLAEALKEEAKNRGVSTEELVGSLVVTPLADQLADIRLQRIDTP